MQRLIGDDKPVLIVNCRLHPIFQGLPVLSGVDDREIKYKLHIGFNLFSLRRSFESF